MPALLPPLALAARGGRAWAAALALAGAALALPGTAAAAQACEAQGGGAQRCTAGIAAPLLPAFTQVQRASNWCWAAAVSMVLGRYGVQVPQEQVVRAQFGAAVNLSLPAQALPALLTRTWRDLRGRVLEATGQPLPPQALATLAPEVLEDLAGGRPLIVGAQRHAVLLVQVAYERLADGRLRLLEALVLDPAAGSGGLRHFTAQELQATQTLARVRVDEDARRLAAGPVAEPGEALASAAPVLLR